MNTMIKKTHLYNWPIINALTNAAHFSDHCCLRFSITADFVHYKYVYNSSNNNSNLLLKFSVINCVIYH